MQGIPSVGDFNATTGVWNNFNLAPGQSANFTIIAKVNATGVMTNYVNATSDVPDPHPGDNTSSSTIEGQPVADVAVTKSMPPNPANYS